MKNEKKVTKKSAKAIVNVKKSGKKSAEQPVTEERGQGRPVEPDSERQKRLAEMAERAKANGGIVRRGRPVDENSERFKRLAAAAEKKAKGIEVKRGRPAKVEIVAVGKKAEKKISMKDAAADPNMRFIIVTTDDGFKVEPVSKYSKGKGVKFNSSKEAHAKINEMKELVTANA